MKRKTKRWEPLRRANAFHLGDGRAEPLPADALVFINRLYQVSVHDVGTVRLLSIKSRDGSPRHDWREFQAIKNQLAGTDAEAVELYPAEARLVDTANQFWLMCLAPGERFPFGFNYREVTEMVLTPASSQRKWSPGDRPTDLVTDRAEMVARLTIPATYYTPADFAKDRPTNSEVSE